MVSMQDLKDKLVTRAKRQLENKNGELLDEDYLMLEDFFEDAVIAIRNWRSLKTDEEFLSEKYNHNIVKYIIRVFQEQGIEGQDSSSVGGDKKTFALTPIQELLSNITQRVKLC